MLAFVIHGYHPFAQDASIYVAGIERQLHRSLFIKDATLLDAHGRLSGFPFLMGGAVRLLHLPLDVFLFLAYVLSILAFLTGCFLVATQVFSSRCAAWSAIFLAGCCLTLPAAGTSVLLMDPYVTARSITTPLSLFALLAYFKRSWMQFVVCFVIMFAVHPLMGLYFGCFMGTFAIMEHHGERAAGALCILGVLFAGAVHHVGTEASTGDAYREAVLSRPYYFLSGWHWYEIVGLVAPLMLMLIASSRSSRGSLAGRLCSTCVFLGTTAMLISLCLVHPENLNLLVRLQVLRIFHTIYMIGVILAGGYLASCFWDSQRWIVVTTCLLAGIGFFLGSVASYPSDPHYQFVVEDEVTPYGQALVWIRGNTPANAHFAIDPDLQKRVNQDEVGFRVVTERSIVTDTKDEGLASLFPAIAAEWQRRRDSERGLDRASDLDRTTHLLRYGVDWLVLSADATTSFPCPYRNAVLAVCRMAQ